MNRISGVTRRDIFDFLRNVNVPWFGRLDEIEFLEGLYDLDESPSFDSRFRTARRDIIQHRRANNDWSDDWIFDDERFGLLDGDDETLLQFLCKILHPETGHAQETINILVKELNRLLAPDGYMLLPGSSISGRDVYTSKRIRPEEKLPLDSENISIPPRCWDTAGFRLFISHTSLHKIEMGNLRDELRKYHISAFVAHQDIDPTKEWEKEIESALHTMDALLAYLTEGFMQSKWTGQEIGFAVCRRVPIIPVRAGIDPYGFIAGIQGLTPKTTSAGHLAKDVFACIHSNPSLHSKIIEAVVSGLEKSESFDEAKSNFILLENLVGLGDSHIKRIRTAFRENGQLRGCFYVRDRIHVFEDNK